MGLHTGENRCFGIIYLLWGIMISLILALIVFSEWISYAWDRQLNDLILLICGTVVLAGICAVFGNRKNQVNIRHIALLGLVFFFFQVFLLRYYYFRSGWDAGAIIAAADNVARGKPISIWYFSTYPNNIFLTYFFAIILKTCYFIGLSSHSAYLVLILFQCVISYVTGILTFHVSLRISGSERISVIVYVLYLLLIGLSPWVSIPYSDSTGLIFPIAILALYLTEARKTSLMVLKWLSIGFISFIGYKIKPTIFIILIAIFVLEFPKLFFVSSRRRALGFISLILTGILMGSGVAHLVNLGFDQDIDPEARFGMMHFFAMGLNEEQMGGWSGADVGYSGSYSTNRERDIADWNLAKERIKNMGITGLVKQYARKLLTVFNDGSFAWSAEGEFFAEVFEKSDNISQWIRSFVYSDGSRFNVFLKFGQMIWLPVLLLNLVSAFSPKNNECAIIMLTLLGFILYCILFEVRARYIYIYVPLFLNLAGVGIIKMECLLKRVFR